jgi:hypothetical protein
MRVTNLLLIATFSLCFVTCASIDSVSMTNIPKDRSNVITAQAKRGVFLFFNFDNDYVSSVSEDLRKQCSNGVVSGILTKSEKICYIPLCLFYVNKITATGVCNK